MKLAGEVDSADRKREEKPGKGATRRSSLFWEEVVKAKLGAHLPASLDAGRAFLVMEGVTFKAKRDVVVW